MLENYGIKTQVIPSGGGWRYEQIMPDGSTHRIPVSGCAGSDKELVKQVVQFRVNARIDQEDVMFDVSEYIKRVSPQNDRFPKKKNYRPAGKPPKPGHRPLIERVSEWLRFKAPRNPRLLIEDEADERAQVCIGCQHNVEWRTLCAPCVENVSAHAQNLRQRPGYKLDDKLKGCRLHDLHLGAAVWLDRDALPVTHCDAPANCWMRRHE